MGFYRSAILVKDPVTGKEVYAMVGDFDDKPSDYEFSANESYLLTEKRNRQCRK